MGGAMKLMLVGSLVLLQTSLWAQRVEFKRGNQATLETRSLSLDSMGTTEFSLSIPHVDVNQTQDGFSAVEVTGLVPSEDYGNPETYRTGSLIAVPVGFEPELQVVDSKTETLDSVVIRPSQRKFRCNGSLDSFYFNSSLYRSSQVYPSEVAALEEVGQLQGVRLVRVALNPVQMDFAHGKTLVTSDLKVRVSLKQVARSQSITLPRTTRELILKSIANADAVSSLIREAGGAETYVIFVADALKTAIQPLVQWKQQKGYNVQVVTTTEAGSTKEAIKKFAQNLYDTAQVKPSYFLFVGNNTTLPTNFESTGSGSAATDYTYTLLAGADAIPDVGYGRLAADNEAEVATQINRWIDYEKNAQVENWYPQEMSIASNEGSNPSDKEYGIQVQDALKAGTYKKFDGFFQGDLNATAKNITEALNEGRSWIAYFGHGSGTSWGSTNDTFSNATVATLSNVGKLPVIIDVACQNASWAKLPKCFGKAWVTQEKDGKAAGAVAFYGGSVNISWHPPAVMSVGIAKAHFEKNLTHIANNALAGQLYLIEKMGNNSQTLDNVKWYNLLGDPSLEMRTATPAEIKVKATNRDQKSREKLSVSAVDASGKALSGLLVSVTKVGRTNPLAVGMTDAEGEVSLDLGIGSLEPDLLVTVTGYNVKTHQQVLPN